MTGPSERVRAAVGPEVLRLLEDELSAGDLTTLLLSVAAARAARTTPSRLATGLRSSRFTRPADVDARRTAAVEHRIWELLPAEVVGLDLSPLAPLGVCSALAGVDQNRVVTTMRGAEVVSDATNVLAVEAALRRRAGAEVVHLAAAHRVLRAQAFGPGAGAHFRLFSLVSSARDRGGAATEADLLLRHLLLWARVLVELGLGARTRLEWTVFRAGAAAERLHDVVLPGLGASGVAVAERRERSGGAYYGDLAVKVVVDEEELGDGGLVPWTGEVLADRKERTVISCLATERLVALLRR